MNQEQFEQIMRRLDRFDAFLLEYYRNNTPTSTTFTKKCYFPGGIDISQGTINIGNTSSLIGHFGGTPVARQGAITTPTGGGTASTDAIDISARTAIGQIKTALQNLNLTA